MHWTYSFAGFQTVTLFLCGAISRSLSCSQPRQGSGECPFFVPGVTVMREQTGIRRYATNPRIQSFHANV